MRSWIVLRYIFKEMLPTFLIGVFVFVFILLMFQALRLTEFVLIHGVAIMTIVKMMHYLSISFLPILFPMSLLFTVLLTYGRLSADSEIVAFRAVGLNTGSIIRPAIFLSIAVAALSWLVSSYVAPWGNHRFETLINQVGSSRPTVTLKEGTFSEGFFDLVIYANKVDSEKGKLEQVFIFDERNRANPITVIASEGRVMMNKTGDPSHPQNNASLRLIDGSIHRTSEAAHTKIDFSSYDIFLADQSQKNSGSASPTSLTLDEIWARLKGDKIKDKDRVELETEFHKRNAISFACILFGLIGVGIGTVTNRRSVKSGGTVVCLALIITYYILYVVSEGAARKGDLPPFFAMWLTNALFSIAAFFSLRRAWQ
jgi:lipopolysaccharide export system permease protein